MNVAPLRTTARYLCTAMIAGMLGVAAAQVGDPPAAADTRLVIYDVRDLAELLGTWTEPVSGENRDRESLLRAGMQTIVQTICEECLPPVAFEDDLRAMSQGTLVLRASPQSHAWVSDMLFALRTSWSAIAQVDTLLCHVDEAAWPSLGFDAGSTSRVQSDADADAWLARLAATAGVDRVHSPRLSVYLTQRGMVSVTTRTEYVAGYDVHERVLPVGNRMVVPRIGHVDEGVLMTCRVVPMKGDRYQLSTEVKLVDLMRPLQEIETEHGAALDPVTQTRTVSSQVTLAAGGLVLFHAGERQGRRLLVGVRLAKVVRGESITPEDPLDDDK